MTDTIIPTAEQVALFKKAWAAADDLDLKGTRTLIALAAVLNNAPVALEPPTVAVEVKDTDGDIWKVQPDGTWTCYSHRGERDQSMYANWSYDTLADRLGPLKITVLA